MSFYREFSSAHGGEGCFLRVDFAFNQQVARFEAEAGKTYYFKWTAGTMGTGIKVTPVGPSVGANEMSKLHLSKPDDSAATDGNPPDSQGNKP